MVGSRSSKKGQRREGLLQVDLHRNRAISCDFGDEGRGISLHEAGDGRKGLDEYLSHLFGPAVATCFEREQSHPGIFDCKTFRGPIPDHVILCEGYPSLLPDFREPFFILCVWRKEVVVNIHFDACLTQRRGNRFLPERAVDEENGTVRRLCLKARSGSLPRFRMGIGHNRPLIP